MGLYQPDLLGPRDRADRARLPPRPRSLEPIPATPIQEANLSRYEGWRGTRLRDDGPSAASIMAAELRARPRLRTRGDRGFVLVFVGLPFAEGRVEVLALGRVASRPQPDW